MRSLTPHYSNVPKDAAKGEGGGVGLYDTWTAAAAFHVNRLDWVYTTNASFVEAAKSPAHGVRTVSLAMNTIVPDPGGGFDIGRVENLYGQKISAPWMRAWPHGGPAWGCINNKDYLEIAFDRATELVQAGTDDIQHDDPESNGGVVTWDNGNASGSGCYCSYCMAKYTEALLAGGMNASARALNNITSAFNYKEFLLAQEQKEPHVHGPDCNHDEGSKDEEMDSGPPPSAKAALLRSLFVEFQENSTERYVRDLRAHTNAAAGRNITFSCNNGGRWGNRSTPWGPFNLFDFGIGELAKSQANPGGLYEIFVSAVPQGKKQVMTMPKAKNITAADVPLIRWSIAYAYALGANIMVPWGSQDSAEHFCRSSGAALHTTSMARILICAHCSAFLDRISTCQPRTQ